VADNVVLNAGSGGVTALTDDCTTGHAQIIKLAISTDGSATLIPADATNGLLVDVVDDATRDCGIVDIGAALPAGTNNIGDVDVLSVVPGTGATNLGKAIDTATGGTDTGVLVLATRDDALSALTPVEGDNVQLRTDANGALWTTVSGTVTVGSHAVTNAGTFAVQVDGQALSAAQTVAGAVYNEDFGALTGDPGMAVLAVRRDADTSLVGADNDYANLQVNANGALKVEIFDGGDSHTVDGTVTVTQATAANLNCTEASAASIATNTSNAATSLAILDDWDNGASDGASVSGDVAHDTADAGEPVKIGAFAETAPSGRTPVADGDRTNLIAGADGVLIVRPYCGLEDIVSAVDTDTAGDSTSVISAPGAGIRLYITSVIVKNTHASTDAYIDIRDGTAGSVLATIPAPAAGGAVVNFPVPLRLTANTACAVDPSAAVTTIITTVVGFKAAV
jgi:hypothetical protein